MEQGNNIECLKTFRMRIPLFGEQGNNVPGQKYFFPDNPIFKGKNIVGIDLNAGGIIQTGDLKADNDQNLGVLINVGLAAGLLCTIYGADKMEKFTNVPLRSFFMIPSVTSQANPRRVKPYYGEIYPRLSYLYFPVNITLIPTKAYVSLTFYYN